jgi:hypothetical protein
MSNPASPLRLPYSMVKSEYNREDPGNGGTIVIDRQFANVPVVTAGAETRVLPQPDRAGLLLTVVLKTRVGDCTLTVTGGYNQGGNTSISFNTAGDWVSFRSVGVGTDFYWRVLSSEGTSLAGGENALTGVTAGTAGASKALVLDAYKAVRIGQWAATGAATNAVDLAATLDADGQGQIDVFSVFGASTANLTSAYSAKVGRFRHIATGSGLTVAQETYGLVGQMCAKGATLTHLHAGLMGTFEGTGAAVVCASGYSVAHAGVIARIGGHANITATTPLAGFLAFNNAPAALAGGISTAFAASSFSATYPWSVGLYMPVGSVNQAVRIGAWAATGTTGSAIPISAATDSADTSQRNVVAVYGESTTNLTNAVHANVGRFRHLVSGSGLTVAHETYGLVGQLCVKGTTLTHMHAGLMGTFEGTGAGVVANSAYTYGVAAVIGRVGGGANIVATKCVCGVAAILNSAAVYSGTSSAFASDSVGAGDWDYGVSLKDCTRAFNFVGACVNAKQAGSIDSSHSILIHVDGQPYALPVHAV